MRKIHQVIFSLCQRIMNRIQRFDQISVLQLTMGSQIFNTSTLPFLFLQLLFPLAFQNFTEHKTVNTKSSQLLLAIVSLLPLIHLFVFRADCALERTSHTSLFGFLSLSHHGDHLTKWDWSRREIWSQMMLEISTRGITELLVALKAKGEEEWWT